MHRFVGWSVHEQHSRVNIHGAHGVFDCFHTMSSHALSDAPSEYIYLRNRSDDFSYVGGGCVHLVTCKASTPIVTGITRRV